MRNKRIKKENFNLERFFFLPLVEKKGKKYHGVQERAVNKKKEETPKHSSCTPGEIGKPPLLLQQGDFVVVGAGVEAIPS